MSEEGIFANILFCIPFGLLMLILFMHYRASRPVFYNRNILLKGRSVLGTRLHKEFGNWFKDIVEMDDTMILSVSGLDVLVTISAIRLLIIFACILALPCLLILVPYYYAKSDHSSAVHFETFSIVDLYTDSFWPPLIVLSIVTAVVIYGVYIFYSNFVRMRQAFLLRPSGFKGVGEIVAKTESFGSLKPARQRFDLPTYTVLLHPIPLQFATPDQLQQTLENSGILGIKYIQFIGNFEAMNKIMSKRNSTLNQLETALKSVNVKLTKSNDEQLPEQPQTPLTIKERSNLLNQLINDTEFCSEFRPRHKLPRSVGTTDDAKVDSVETVDSLQYFYKELEEYENQLQSALINFNTVEINSDTSSDSNNNNNSNSNSNSNNNSKTPSVKESFVIETSEDPTNTDKNGSINFEKRYIDETTFISWKKISELQSNLSQVSSLVQTQTALLHFSDYRQACRAQQIFITSQPNTMIAEIAPGPNNLNWENVKMSHRQRWTGILKSNILYWTFLIMFAPLSAMAIAIVDIEEIGKIASRVENFRKNYPIIKEILQGVLAPMIATLLFKKTGSCINYIMAIRGPLSKSEHALKTQSAHVFFLFFQIIIIGTIFSNIYGFITSVLVSSTTKFGLFEHVRINIPQKAHFFFNFIVQNIFTELILELLNPKKLFVDRLYFNESGRKDKTPRKLLQNDTDPPELDLGLIWSRFIIFPYFVFMTYVVIAPLIVIPVIGYFSVAYFVYRFRLVQFGRLNVETGGLFWRQCTQQIIYGLILCQFSVLLQYTQFKKGFFPSLILLILICATIAFIPFIKYNFGRVSDSLSLLEDDIKSTKSLVQSIIDRQNEILPGAVEYLENSAIVKSHLESDINDHYNFTDADPLIRGEDVKKFNLAEIKESEVKPLFDPYWSMIPLNLSKNSAEDFETFDSLQVDKLIDTSYAAKQYEHPLILEHTQIIVVPRELFSLLRLQKSNHKPE